MWKNGRKSFSQHHLCRDVNLTKTSCNGHNHTRNGRSKTPRVLGFFTISAAYSTFQPGDGQKRWANTQHLSKQFRSTHPIVTFTLGGGLLTSHSHRHHQECYLHLPLLGRGDNPIYIISLKENGPSTLSHPCTKILHPTWPQWYCNTPPPKKKN